MNSENTALFLYSKPWKDFLHSLSNQVFLDAYRNYTNCGYTSLYL